MSLVYAFLFGGIICLIAQLIYDNTSLSIGHITSLFVVIGCFLELGNIYDKFVSFANVGAMLPISSFGHLLSQGALEGFKENGIIGLFSNCLVNTSLGISFAVFISFLIALFFKSKS